MLFFRYFLLFCWDTCLFFCILYRLFLGWFTFDALNCSFWGAILFDDIFRRWLFFLIIYNRCYWFQDLLLFLWFFFFDGVLGGVCWLFRYASIKLFFFLSFIEWFFNLNVFVKFYHWLQFIWEFDFILFGHVWLSNPGLHDLSL